MGATLNLDKFELLWFCDGFVGKSHLRWDGYKIMIDNVFPQLNEAEREFIYTYAKRDFSWMFDKEKRKYVDDTPAISFRQMLARYNPANQYKVKLDNGNEVETVDAYKWGDRYYGTERRSCNPDYIVNVEHKQYRKCRNTCCDMRDKCLRYTEHKDGDEMLEGANLWFCKDCDLKITEIETI